MNVRTALIAVALSVCLAGCASEVVPTTSHQPTDPSQVKIYQKAPAKYEELGEISVPVAGNARWDDKGDANAGFDRLRAEAAARGANGILLDPDSVNAQFEVTAGDRGQFYNVPMRSTPNRAAVAEAIYVHEEK